MSVYQPPAFDARIDLDLSKNEGTPVISSLGFDSGTIETLTSRYPDSGGLTDAIGTAYGVLPERVLVTAGGDDALFRCLLASGGGSVVATTPSFEMIRNYSTQLGLPLFEIPWWDGGFPVDEFLESRNLGAAEPDRTVAVVVSPNNPTGSCIGPGELRKIADAYPLVVLDAAYAEFAEEDLTPMALDLDNVVVIRTLSKAYGLAGLRVGYLIGPAEIVARLRGFGSPYSVSALSLTLAQEVLASSPPDTGPVVEGRERIRAVLAEAGVESLPSQGNFVLAAGVDDDWLVGAAASLGVALRRFPNRPELASCVRITIPSRRSNLDRLEHTLRTALAPEALLFDMDGVLADVTQSYRRAIVETAAHFGVEVTPDQIAAAKAAGTASDDWAVTHHLVGGAAPEVSYEDVRDVFESFYQGGLKDRESLLVDPKLLRSWAERLPLAVVTARPRADAEGFLQRFSIADCFRAVVTREDAASKPDPEPVTVALERLGVNRAWMLGDTRDDIDAARGAGVIPIGVRVPGDDPVGLFGAARVLGSANQLQEVLYAAKV